MKRVLQCALVLLPCALLPAQDKIAAEAKSRLAELNAAYQKFQGDWMDAYRAAAEAENEAKITAAMDERTAMTQKFAAEFYAAGQKYAGTEHAVPFLVWVCGNDYSSPNAKEALGTLIENHIQSPELASLVSMIRYIDSENGPAYLGRIIENSQESKVIEQALFTRAEMITSSETTDAERASAIADFRKVIEMTSDARMKTRAEGAIFEAENLAIGMVAPEIEAEDLDGVKFKLSDYRGKVVMLDFWGDW